jgi:hypothetical protein
VAVNAVEDGVNVPVPVLVQLPVDEPPLTVPLNATLALLAQTVWLLPAVAVAGVFTITVVTATGLVQPLTVAVTE